MCLVCCSTLAAQAQKEKTVTGSHLVQAPLTMTPQQADEQALLRAQTAAIDSAFRTNIISMASTMLTESSQSIYMETHSSLRGEWVKTIGKPRYRRGFTENGFWVECTVKGVVREIVNAKVPLEVAVLCNDVEGKTEKLDFKDGENMYLRFRSPVTGWLAVWFYDNTSDMVSLILPYKASDDIAPRTMVKADQEYTFFSKQKAPKGSNVREILEYDLHCGDQTETNTLIMVFSTKPFTRPVVDSEQLNRRVAPHVSYEKFNSWLSRAQSQDKDMQVTYRSITISK